MNEKKPPNHPSGSTEFSRRVGAQESRKREAQRKTNRILWFGFGMFGLIGWSVVIPAILGAILGGWLDHRFPGKHSWTLTLLLIGLMVGCLNAWHWINKENKEMHEKKDDTHE